MTEKERFKIFIAAYLVLLKDGKILLSRRHNTGYQDGKYSLVAGHLDGGETASQCIIREAKEEADISLEKADLKVACITHRTGLDREYIDIYLIANNWTGEPKIMEPNKCSELRWFSVQNLPHDLLPDVRYALENIEKGIYYGEFGWE